MGTIFIEPSVWLFRIDPGPFAFVIHGSYAVPEVISLVSQFYLLYPEVKFYSSVQISPSASFGLAGVVPCRLII